MSGARAFDYTPDGAVLQRFMLSDAYVRGLMGPWGSGKSAACCVELFRRAVGQAPASDGVRRTRWAVLRNTGPQLKMTTMKTWLEWFPEAVFGKFSLSPPFKHMVKLGPLGDGTSIEMEVFFIALDNPGDVDTLYSLELTGAWVNEARFIPKEVIDALTGRVNRYPSKKQGGPTWAGVLMDTNAPADDHWWAIMCGDKPAPEYWSEEDRLTMVAPSNWAFFKQPAAMLEDYDGKKRLVGYSVNPAGENVRNLAANYYANTIQGKPRQWIAVNILNRYGSSFDGKPVFPSFRAEAHVATEDFAPLEETVVHVGIDFGRTPAAIFGQRRGLRWFISWELVTDDMAVVTFAPLLRAFIADRFPPGLQYRFWGDPSGDVRAQTRDETPFEIMRACGVACYPAPSNDPSIRVEAVESVLRRMEGEFACFQISPRCRVLRAGMEGGYHYRKLNVSSGGGDLYAGEPVKNRFSHPCEGMEYMLLGAGEGRELVKGPRPSAPVVAPRRFDVLNRQSRFLSRERAGPFERRG